MLPAQGDVRGGPVDPQPGTEPGMQGYRRSFRLPDTWVQRVRHWYPEQVTAAQVRADPGGYILCMSFFDITELVDIDPASGVWIYSSSEPHNEEQQFEAPSLYHASGHISGPELLEMIRRIAPGSVIPSHTSSPELFARGLASEMPVLLPAPHH